MERKTKAMMWLFVAQIVRLIVTIIVLLTAAATWPWPGQLIGGVGLGLLLLTGIVLHVIRLRIAR
jgi:hypothetical protein